MASPLTVYSTSADGEVNSTSSTYSTARAGGSTKGTSTAWNWMTIGQATGYWCYESFVGFDTSSIGADATVTAATLYLGGGTDYSTTDFTIEARKKDWGGTITTADWVPGANLSGYSLCATYPTSSGFAFPNVYALSSDAGFPGLIEKTSTTYIVLSSSRTRTGDTPGGPENVSAAQADYTGTDKDPKLVVTYSVASASFLPHIMRHHFIPSLRGGL